MVELEEVKENDYNLNIRRYADTSPPSEPYDVRAILHGGIPVSEVENDYVQEALDGFDVSVVFEDSGDGYYEFKTAIKGKGEIREHLGTDNAGIIAQFEKWWDKYKVSLRELDVEVESAEMVMKEYLQELGYE